MGNCVEYYLRYMKFSLSVLLALVGAWAAQAELTIVSGNVYDVGKYSKSSDEWIHVLEDDNDSNMCWAAAASNVIQYWQDTYYNQHDGETTPVNGVILSGYTDPNGSGCLNVYKEFVTKWRNTGGTAMNAFTWWLQGKKPDGTNGNYYPDGSSLENPSTVFGGFYTGIFGANARLPKYPQTSYADERGNYYTVPFYSAKMSVVPGQENQPKFADVQSAIINAFKHDAQAVVLDLTTGISGHSISCWGYETNEAGNITTLILSDSDDIKYGTFMVELTQNEEGYACISTDRNRSDYHGNHAIADVVYINTPAGYSEELTGQASIESLDAAVTTSGRLTKSASIVGKDVTIGGGTYSNSNVIQAVAFTSAKNANISIVDGQMKIEDGAMALLYGGLSVQSSKQGGVVADGHLYVHGGAVNIKDCSAFDSGGGIQATDTYGEGLSANTYIEMRDAGDINLSSNTSTTQDREELIDGIYEYHNAGGGAVYSADSLSIRNSGNVTINKNLAEGYNVHGGGTFAEFNTIISGNKDVAVTNNSTKAEEGYISYGGGIAGMYVDVNENQEVSFSGNSVSVTNESAKGWIGTEGVHNVYEGGASAAGGAIAVHPYADVTYYDRERHLIEVPTTLNVNRNASVTFKDNTVSATYTGDISQDYGINRQQCTARGGAVYLSYQIVDDTTIGTEASISQNEGDVVFSGNKATSNSTTIEGNEAQGGAVFISKASSLIMDSNGGDVVFSGNSVTGTTAQGGGIYNAGKLAITRNDAVTFSNNTAKEGSHIFNDAEGVAEIAWNDKVLFTADTTAAGSTVVNKGEMYLAAGQGQEIQFHNTMLDTTQGTLTVGLDTEGTAHATTLTFTKGTTAAAPQARTNVSTRGGVAVELRGLSLSVDNIAGGQGVYLNGVAVATNTNLVVEDMTIGTDMLLEEGSAEHLLTLNKVKIDLGDVSPTSTLNDKGGKDYVFDLRGMLSGAITLNDVVFDASDFFGTEMDFLNRDRVCMMFGDVTYFPKTMDKTTISMVGSGDISVYCEVVDGGNVYFGEWFQVPEPTTSTLSLLALCALSVRRRRK